jgi:hypothetical protein
MANLKKMDDQDFVFINKPLSVKEQKAFRDFLKARKLKMKTKQTSRIGTRTKKALA